MDTRFLLPDSVERVTVLGGLAEWRERLAEVGLDSLPRGERAPDLAVAPSSLAGEAIATGARAVILEGRGGGRPLRRAGFEVSRFLPVPSAEDPNLLLPLADARPARYALERLLVPRRRWKQARNRLLAGLLSLGALPPLRPLVTVASRTGRAPLLVEAAARRFALPSELAWLLVLGERETLTRNAFLLFPAEADAPRWVLKFGRVPGLRERFEADERGLECARAAGSPVAERAPRLLGRLELGELHASVETAAVGTRLVNSLTSPGRRPAKLRVVESVAEWAVELGRKTASTPEQLGPERDRLKRDVIPRWSALGVTTELVDGLPPIPAVLQHGNLGTLNVLVDGSEFTVVDWETARPAGLPLWDVVYLLADALAHLDGAPGGLARERHFARLFRDELPSSRILFGWTRRAGEACGVPLEAAGRLVTLGWLDEGLANVARVAAAGRFDPGPSVSLAKRLAELWLSDPALGPAWTLER